MRSLLTFILGIIVGAGAMLFLPELTSRREHLNEEMKKQVETLQNQVHDLGEQIKKANPPKASDETSKPTSTPSPAH